MNTTRNLGMCMVLLAVVAIIGCSKHKSATPTAIPEREDDRPNPNREVFSKFAGSLVEVEAKYAGAEGCGETSIRIDGFIATAGIVIAEKLESTLAVWEASETPCSLELSGVGVYYHDDAHPYALATEPVKAVAIDLSSSKFASLIRVSTDRHPALPFSNTMLTEEEMRSSDEDDLGYFVYYAPSHRVSSIGGGLIEGHLTRLATAGGLGLAIDGYLPAEEPLYLMRDSDEPIGFAPVFDARTSKLMALRLFPGTPELAPVALTARALATLLEQTPSWTWL